MGRPPLTVPERARGLLLGLAAGSALGANGRGGPDLPLALLLAEELLEPDVDLRRLADRWIGWWRTEGRDLDLRTAEALDHLAHYDAPPPPGNGPGEAAPVARCLPVALAAWAQPRNLVSGTYHTASLTHPNPRSAWGAVAVNVAAARFLQGKRDFIPDVIEVLRVNDAPADLVSAVRRVPFVTRDDVHADRVAHGPAVACVELAFWTIYHEPVAERGVPAILAAGGDQAATTAGVTAALLGAMEGEDGLPGPWLARVEGRSRIGALARRLVTPRPTQA
jgi:ADP-ribosylglycohydrolase